MLNIMMLDERLGIWTRTTPTLALAAAVLHQGYLIYMRNASGDSVSHCGTC